MSIILEKLIDNIDISKLRVIFLLKVYYNTMNKINFNNYLMPKLEQLNAILCEVIREQQNQVAIHAVLNKKLVSDISNQFKALLVVILVDALNYYNHITYLLAGLTCRHFRL